MISIETIAGLDIPPEEVRSIVEEAAKSAFSVLVISPITEILGSGFAVGDGIVTAKHVVAPVLVPGTGNVMIGAIIRVKPLVGAHRYQTTYLKAISPHYDIALLEVPAGITPLEWGDSENLQVGDYVVVLAAPNTISEGFTSYAGVGRVLATSTVVPELFRYEIPVQPGSSGGPVLILDTTGKVVGINLLQERIGDKIVGSGLKAHVIRAVLSGEPVKKPLPVLVPEGLDWVDALMIGAGAALVLYLLD